jgi:hypothetical protein
MTRNNTQYLLVLYVDDMVVGCSYIQELNRIVDAFKARYTMDVKGEPKVILGIHTAYDIEKGILSIDQKAYAIEILEEFGSYIEGHSITSTPAHPLYPLSANQCPISDTSKEEMLQYPYRSLVGKLMYLMVGTRVDITYAVGQLAKYGHNPGKAHWDACLHLLRYLKGTLDYCITYTRSNKYELLCFADSDHAK